MFRFYHTHLTYTHEIYLTNYEVWESTLISKKMVSKWEKKISDYLEYPGDGPLLEEDLYTTNILLFRRQGLQLNTK